MLVTHRSDAKQPFTSDNPALKGQLSAVLRDQLLSQLREIKSLESATIWARRILPAKNTLSAADAQQVEEAFRARLAELSDRESEQEALRPSSTSTPKSALDRKRQRQKSIELRSPRTSIKANYHIPSRADFAIGST